MLLHLKRLHNLHPDLVRFAKEAEHAFEKEFDIAIVSGWRSESEQLALYAKGRTAKGEPPYTEERPLGLMVTEAEHATQTAHGRGCAFDFCPVIEGNWLWHELERFEQVGRLAEAAGLEWGGRWLTRGKGDLGHIQVPNWRDVPMVLPREGD